MTIKLLRALAVPAAVIALGAAPAAQDAMPHVSHDTRWAGSMVIVVLGLFLAAAAVGPVVRAEMPAEEEPESHGHDDHHGHH
jgi:hypothetical protein